MTSGQLAEQAVADELQSRNYKVIERNWQPVICEVDIVALAPDNRLCIVEVKYRKTKDFGDGFVAINRKKLEKLRLAVKLWQHIKRWDGEICILVAAVSGQHQENIDIIELQ